MLYLWQLRYTIVERNYLKTIVGIFGNCVLQVPILLATMWLATYAETGGEVGVERTDFDAHWMDGDTWHASESAV